MVDTTQVKIILGVVSAGQQKDYDLVKLLGKGSFGSVFKAVSK